MFEYIEVSAFDVTSNNMCETFDNAAIANFTKVFFKQMKYHKHLWVQLKLHIRIQNCNYFNDFPGKLHSSFMEVKFVIKYQIFLFFSVGANKESLRIRSHFPANGKQTNGEKKNKFIKFSIHSNST